MIQNPFYSSTVTINTLGERSIENKFDYWNGWDTDEFIKAQTTQDLINGKAITIKNCSILVTFKNDKSDHKLRQLLDIANQVLQEDFKMDFNDEFGLHRTVIADSVHIYPCKDYWRRDYSFQIQFDMTIKLAEYNMENLIEDIKHNGFVSLYPFTISIKALKLEHDKPYDYKITKIQGEYWIHQRTPKEKDLWKYYAPQILHSMDYENYPISLMQLSCQDKELRDRLQKIDSSNGWIVKHFQQDLAKYTAQKEAILKFFELQDNKSNIKEKVGLYIVKQIHENPEKYLNSEYSFIREIAQEIRSHS